MPFRELAPLTFSSDFYYSKFLKSNSYNGLGSGLGNAAGWTVRVSNAEFFLLENINRISRGREVNHFP